MNPIEVESIFTIEQSWRIYKFTIKEFPIFTIGVEFAFTIEKVLGIYIHNWGSIYIKNL